MDDTEKAATALAKASEELEQQHKKQQKVLAESRTKMLPNREDEEQAAQAVQMAQIEEFRRMYVSI